MRTNIEIDDKLMKDAIKASRVETKTKKAVVEEALQLLIKSRAQEISLHNMFGKGQFWDGYDYKAMRNDAPPDAPSATAKRDVRKLQTKRTLRRKAA